MLDEAKIDCINMIVEGVRISDIAIKIKKSRQTIYNWLNDDKEFKAELDRVLQRIKSQGEQKILVNLNKYIDNIEYLAMKAKSEKIKLDANAYLTDRVLGRPTSKLNVQEENKEEEATNILNDINEIESELNNNMMEATH
ncbi:MAG: helix-turn-helix domain-containing protein [Tissierellia bacterium]|nr:helix-turn-helix domain-containing protein [Tissierellia bacterium]